MTKKIINKIVKKICEKDAIVSYSYDDISLEGLKFVLNINKVPYHLDYLMIDDIVRQIEKEYRKNGNNNLAQIKEILLGVVVVWEIARDVVNTRIFKFGVTKNVNNMSASSYILRYTNTKFKRVKLDNIQANFLLNKLKQIYENHQKNHHDLRKDSVLNSIIKRLQTILT